MIIRKGGNFAANKFQDDFKVKISEVDSSPFSLKTAVKLKIKDKESGAKVVTSDEVIFDINFNGIIPVLDIRISDTNVMLTKDQLTRLSQKKQSEEKKDKESSDVISYLGTIEVRDLDVSFSDENETLFTHLLALDLDFPEGKGSLKGISAHLQKEDIRLVDVENIDLEFNSEGILGDESAKLAVTIEKANARLAKRAVAILKELLKFPDKNNKNGSSPLKEISSIQLNNSRMTDVDRNLAAFTGKILVDLEKGDSVISDLRADWTHTGRKLVSLNKMSGKFSPEDIFNGAKPELRLILTDLRLVVGKELQAMMKNRPDKKDTAQSDPPFSISRILIGSSSIRFPDLPGIGNQKHLAVREIFGNLNNLTFEPGTPLAKFNFNASFEGETKLMANGQIDLAHSPFQVSVDYRIFDFDMTKLNPELRARIPITFREGEFDLMGEVIKREEDYIGYFKPFLTDASYLGNKKEFKNTRHFFVEIGAAITNWLFENSETETVATNVPFIVKDGSVEFNANEAFWSAVEHGLFQSNRISPQADKFELKQAQESGDD